MHVEAEAGGGWLGAFGLPVIRHLYEKRGQPDLRAGVSVGAINQVMAAQGELDVLQSIWGEIDDDFSLDGIDGFMKLVPFKGDGIFNLNSIREKLREHVSLDKLQTRFVCGAVSRDLAYRTFASEQMDSDKRLRKAILASCSIAVVMDSVSMRVGGQWQPVYDGGHLHPFPLLPVNVTEVDAILHHPLNPIWPIPQGEGVLGALNFTLAAITKMGHERTLDYLRGLASTGVKVRIWAPLYHLGDLLDASQEMIQGRYTAGDLTVLNGPVVWGPK